MKDRITKGAIRIFLLTGLALLLCAPLAMAQGAPQPKPNGKVAIDFNDADIKLFIKFMADLTGRNYVIDEKVKGKVTIMSPNKVTVDEAEMVFESTLEVYGYTLIDAGNVTKVIPAAEARQRGAFGPGPSQAGDRIVTRLIPLRYVKSNEMVTTLRPLIPVTSYLTSYGGTNTLILVDYASNAEKILGIVSQLDVAGQEEVITVAQLKFAGAKEMAGRLDKLFGKGASEGVQNAPRRQGAPTSPALTQASQPGHWSKSKPQIIPDERVNSIILVANKTTTDQIMSLIEQLDVPAPPGQGKINVYYLRNADAEEMAKVLSNITKETSKQPQRGGRRDVQNVKLESEVTVTPDKASNSLVITAAHEDFETLKEVIEKLDVRRRQVFVEALIMEVTSDKKREFGIEWRTTSDFTKSGVQGIGGTNFGNINTVAENPLSVPQGMTVGVVDGIISFAGKEFLNLGALVHALQTESGINILSTPNIMTTDNEEAEIVVAQNVPFITGESQNTGGTTLTTIERRDIGITLRITPQISESDVVKLNVYQEISSISPTQLEKAKDLITFKRSVNTTVVVRDGQNLALGGLIRDDLTDSVSKVPLLGDIPFLGWLFKSKGKQKTKTNLLVFLTPHIIKNDEDAQKITEKQREVMQVESQDSEFGSAVGITDKKQKKEKKSDGGSGSQDFPF